ncbi:MAG: hypothetical protein VX938_08245, partial [Myxococcota bacterium]|nr:hypothetical protein [Myxococcota bacterium]
MLNVLKSLLLSVVCVGSGIAAAEFWWPWGLTASVPLAAIALWSMQKGWEDLSERSLENKALKVFRSMENRELTKDILVRHHDVRPREAEAILAWLLRHELVQADWDEEDLDNPIVYRASERAIPGPATGDPPPLELPPPPAPD